MDIAGMRRYHKDTRVAGWVRITPLLLYGKGVEPLSGILQALSLAHGFLATNYYGVGIVDDPVTDSIS